jgi:lysozyme family protein
MPTESFDRAINRILAHEGGYVNDRFDLGGETKYGISKRAYPSVDIKNLTRDGAKALYHRDYWQAIQGDLMHPAVAFQVMDAAVNHGVSWASKTLQRAAGVTVDGKIGPKTTAAANGSPKAVIEAFNNYRERYYRKLATFPRFGKGWLSRLNQNRKFALEDLA